MFELIRKAGLASRLPDAEETSLYEVAYMRVSSLDRNEVRQLAGLALDKTFTEKTSGQDVKRPQLEAMQSFVRDGDTVFCHSMDRLAGPR